MKEEEKRRGVGGAAHEGLDSSTPTPAGLPGVKSPAAVSTALAPTAWPSPHLCPSSGYGPGGLKFLLPQVSQLLGVCSKADLQPALG